MPAFLAWVVAGWFAPGVLGDWGLFPMLGVFPGVALATLLPLERGPLARWTLGIAISPLVATVAAWGLMRAGLPLPAAARAVPQTWRPISHASAMVPNMLHTFEIAISANGSPPRSEASNAMK